MSVDRPGKQWLLAQRTVRCEDCGRFRALDHYVTVLGNVAFSGYLCLACRIRRRLRREIIIARAYGQRD